MHPAEGFYTRVETLAPDDDDDDGMGFNVLRCGADILGTNSL